MIKTRITIAFLFSLFSISIVTAQGFPEQAIKKKLKARKIEMDEGNGDGVFKAKSRKTRKWGMYQWMYEGTKVKELIPMAYDSLRYFPFNGAFTAVYNNGKVGIYLSAWTFDEDAKQTIECKYEDYRRVRVRKEEYSMGTIYLAMKKNGLWGWVDWMTGEEKSDFAFETLDDLPFPQYEQ